MTNSIKSKEFDCVRSMRDVRDKISREIEGLSHDELTRWIRVHRYTHPILRQLAQRVTQQGEPAEKTSF